MALTSLSPTQQTQLMDLIVGMFDAAPGAVYFDDIAAVYLANGGSLTATAKTLATTDTFHALYSTGLTSAQFATAWLTTLGLQGNAEAVDYVVSRANAGVDRGQIISDAVTALLGSTSATFAEAKALLQNRVAVASYYTIDLNIQQTDFAKLQAVLVGVTSDVATVAAKEAIILNNFLDATGKTFELTPGVDTVTGTIGNDKIIANVENVGGTPIYTLNAFDNINGGAGNDTLTVNDLYSDPLNWGDLILPDSASVLVVKNVENLVINHVAAPWGYDVEADVQTWAGLQTVTVTNADGTGYVEVLTSSNVTSVTVNGGDDVYAEDLGTTDTLATLTSTGNTGDITVISDALTNLNLASESGNATVTAAAGTRTLNIGLNKVTGGVVTDGTATTVSITSSGAANDIGLSAATATTLNIAGDKAFTLDSLAAAKLTTINASTDTGGVTVTPALGTGIAFTGGSGKDTITVGATTKAIDMGAGDDTVNLTVSALGTGGTVTGGAGTDTLSMSAANAAAASVDTKFNAVVTSFEKLKLAAVPSGESDSINLTNVNGISFVTSAGVSGGTAVQEVQTFTVSASDSTGGSVLVGGVPVSVANGAGATDVAAAIAAASASIIAANPTIASVTSSGSQVTVTYLSSAGNVGNITLAENGSGVTANATVTTVGGTSEVTEQQTITVNNVVDASGIVTIGGTPVSLFTGETTAQVAARISAALNTTMPTGVSSVSLAGNVVTLTYTAAAGNAAVVSYSDPGNVFTGKNDPAIVDNARAYVAPAAETQTVTITAGTDSTGGSILVNGARIDLAPNLSIDQVGGAIAGSVVAINAADPGVAGIAYDTITDTLTFTYTAAAGNVSGTRTSIAANASSVGFSGVTEVASGVNGTAAGALTLTNMLSGGTFELTGANGGAVTITVKDAATGTADVMNLGLKGSGSIAGGAISVANVETVNFLTDDTATTPTGIAHSATLTDAAAKAITVTGDAGLALTFTGTALTSFDASGVTKGAVSWTTGALAAAATITGGAGANTIDFHLATKAVTYTGGAGVDTVTTNNANNTVSTGGGNDTVITGNGNNTVDLGAGDDYIILGNGLNVVTGGAGVDKYEVFTNLNGNTYTTVTDFAVGDILSLYGTGNSTFTTAKIVLADTAVFQDFLDAATAGTTADVDNTVHWFQFGGNTYVVEDRSAATTFQNGGDLVIKLSGAIDLSTAVWVDATADLTMA